MSTMQSMDPFAVTTQQNVQGQHDAFAMAKSNNTSSLDSAMGNMDPFNTENTPPAPQQCLDPFGLPQIAAAPAQTQQSDLTNIFDPFAKPAPASVAEPVQQQQAPNQVAFGDMDELDRAEALAAQAAEADGDIDLNDVEYEEDETDEDDDDEFRSSEEQEGYSPSKFSKGQAADEFDADFTAADQTLGVLIADSTRYGQQVVVKMVVDNSPGMRECVTEGAVLVGVNKTDVRGKTKNDCTDMIRELRASRKDLTLTFQNPTGRDMMSKDHILARVVGNLTTGVPSFIGNWKRGVATWNDRFYVWGGANDETMQVFSSEQDWQQWNVQFHKAKKGEGKVDIDCETICLDPTHMAMQRYSVNHVKCKEYKARGELFYFALSCSINPPLKMVCAKFASPDRAKIDRLHEYMRHIIRMNKPAKK